MGISMFLVNMPEELLNDAKWHLLEAERYAIEGESAIFLLWREVRVTAVFALAAVESFLNKVADEYVQKNPSLERILKDYLNEKQTIVENGEYKTRNRYIAVDEKLSGWTKIVTSNVFDKSDIVWRHFQEVKKFRDDLIHFKPQEKPSVYDRGTIEMARKSVEVSSAIIERFYNCWGHPVPPWVNAPYKQFE